MANKEVKPKLGEICKKCGMSRGTHYDEFCPTGEVLLGPHPTDTFESGEAAAPPALTLKELESPVLNTLNEAMRQAADSGVGAAAPAKPLRELIEWLRGEAAERRTSATSRRNHGMNPNATEAELRRDKRMAEKMFGRKLDLVSTDPKDNARNCAAQIRIADKLEAEATKIEGWMALLPNPQVMAAPPAPQAAAPHVLEAICTICGKQIANDESTYFEPLRHVMCDAQAAAEAAPLVCPTCDQPENGLSPSCSNTVHPRAAHPAEAEPPSAREPHDGWLNAWILKNHRKGEYYLWDDVTRKMAGDWADFRASSLRDTNAALRAERDALQSAQLRGQSNADLELQLEQARSALLRTKNRIHLAYTDKKSLREICEAIEADCEQVLAGAGQS